MSESKEKSYDEKNKEVMIKIDKNLMEGKRNGLECLDEIKKITELVTGKGNPKKVITILFPIIESIENLDLLQTIIPKIEGGGPVVATSEAELKTGQYKELIDRNLKEDAEKEKLNEAEQKVLVDKLEITLKKEDERLVSLIESSVDPGKLPKALRNNKTAVCMAAAGGAVLSVPLALGAVFGFNPTNIDDSHVSDESLKSAGEYGMISGGTLGIGSGIAGAIVMKGSLGLAGSIGFGSAIFGASVISGYLAFVLVGALAISVIKILPNWFKVLNFFFRKGKRKGKIYEWFKNEMDKGKTEDEQKYDKEFEDFMDNYVEKIEHIQAEIDYNGLSTINRREKSRLRELRMHRRDPESRIKDLSEFLTEESIKKFEENNKKWRKDKKKEIKEEVEKPKGPIRNFVALILGAGVIGIAGITTASVVGALSLPEFMATWTPETVIALGLGIEAVMGVAGKYYLRGDPTITLTEAQQEAWVEWKKKNQQELTDRYNKYLKFVFRKQFTTYCEKAGIPKKFRVKVLQFAIIQDERIGLYVSSDEENVIKNFTEIYHAYMQQYLYHYLKVVYYDKAYLLHQICSSSNLLKGKPPEKWFETLERYREAGQLKGLLDDLERQFLASVDTKREELKDFVKRTDKKGQGFEMYSDNIMRMLVYGNVPMDKWVPLLENLTEERLNGFYETVRSEERKRVVELELYERFENKRGRRFRKMGDDKKVVGVREVKDAQTGALIEMVYKYGRIKKDSSEDFLMIYQKTQLNRELQVFEQEIDVKSKTKGSLGTDHLAFIRGRLEDVNGILTKGEFRQCISNATGDPKEKDKLMKAFIENSSKLKLSEETKTTKIEAEIQAYKAKKESLNNEESYASTESQRVSIRRNIDSIQTKISELTSKKDTYEREKKEEIENTTKLFSEHLSGKYSGGYISHIHGGLNMEPILKKLLGGELKTLQDFSSIADRIYQVIDKRVKIGKNIESLKFLERTKDTFETGTEKKSLMDKKFHADLYRKFTNRFGEEIGKRIYDRVFSKVVMRNRSIDNNLATLFDENRKDDLNRVLLNENDTTRTILQELCKEYKDKVEQKETKKKEKAEKQKQAKEKAIKMGEKGSIPGKEEDIDVSGVTSSISGLATSAYDKLAGLTGIVKDEKDKMSKDTLTPDLKTKDLQLKEVKSDKRSYKPGDHKPEDLTTITRKELDELRESEETLRKQLEMDRAIIRQYKQNIEHDISEHYKVLKMKEEQLLQKSDYVLREQQKVVAYYMGVLQNRESIILEQEKVLEMKRKRELEEIEELRAKIQHKLIKELEKEKKMMVKHHNKQMRKQKSLLQAELEEYTGDNLYLSQLASKTKSDKGSLKKGALKKEKSVIVQKSFMNTFVY